MQRIAVLAATLIFAPLAAGVSQDGEHSTDTIQTRGGMCFRGRPAPSCRWFWVTEAGFHHVLRSNRSYQSENPFYLVSEFGAMINWGKRSALGAVFFHTAPPDLDWERGGLRLRYRHWLTRSVSIDVAPGIVLSTRGRHRSPGFSGAASLSVGDWVGLTAQLDVVPETRSYGGTLVDLSGGLKAGSYPGVLGHLAMALLYAIAAAQFSLNLSG